MLYWLFTEGRALLIPFTVPLLCLAPPLTVLTALLGASIRRRHETVSVSESQRRALLLTYAIVLLSVASITLSVFGERPIQRMRGSSTTSPILDLLAGAPRGVNPARLGLFGLIFAFTLIVSAAGLHSLLREGGWLRERIDRLRVPHIRRGALGSSHFCTLREYRRFRREDPDGLTLLGAFWGGETAS